ncbi:MAG: hypothetical protein JOZ87_05820 [Chloroflexi bacterium]|nr:hypothetical protein [Chloroflexota bacterium]
MHNGNVWELPFEEPAVLELQAEFGAVSLVPVEPGQRPRLELRRASTDNIGVQVDKVGEVVRVSLGLAAPPSFNNWFSGGWECRATAYLPADVRAAVQTNAGSVSVRGLEGCELGIKANAGKIELVDVYGLIHLAADAGSINGRGLGGYFDVETQAGSVRLEILDLQPGEHRIRASMGSVRLELARGMDVCIETHTSLGSVRNNYPVRADAPQRLVLTTEMGSVRVEEGPSVRPARRPPAQDAATRGDASLSTANAGSDERERSSSARNAASDEREPPPSAPNAASREDPELERILKMVEAGELSARDAEELLQAMGRV